MTPFFCPTFCADGPRYLPRTVRELRASRLVQTFDRAALGSLSTVAVALVSAVALAVLGGA